VFFFFLFFLFFSISFSLFFVVSDGASPAGSECIAAVGGGASSSVTAPNVSKWPGIVVDRLSVTESDDERLPPDHEDHLEFTDGSGNQFQGENNLGRVVTSLIGPTAFRRHSVIGVPAHGKSMGDALGFMIKVKVEEGVRCRRLLLQGTRNDVLYLAQHHPKPKGNPGAKEGMWVPQRCL
jgi:hypothetical protein